MDTTDNALHRIDSYNRFIYNQQQLMLYIGACLGIVTCALFYISDHPHYLYVSSGLAVVSMIWTLRYGGSLLLKKGTLSANKETVLHEIPKISSALRQGKHFIGALLVVLVLASIGVVLGGIDRTILACLIPWILFATVEFILILVHNFRLGLLNQEIFPERSRYS